MLMGSILKYVFMIIDGKRYTTPAGTGAISPIVSNPNS
jgi:hypothetical protein